MATDAGAGFQRPAGPRAYGSVRQPQNLVSYHLRQLRAGGLVTARRSSLDGRDTYYSLNLDSCARALAASVTALHPGLALTSAVPGDRSDD